jgi:hypothetical protein
MNGFIFYKRIKEIDTEIKACFLTASETTGSGVRKRNMSDRAKGGDATPKADME